MNVFHGVDAKALSGAPVPFRRAQVGMARRPRTSFSGTPPSSASIMGVRRVEWGVVLSSMPAALAQRMTSFQTAVPKSAARLIGDVARLAQRLPQRIQPFSRR